MNVQDASSRLDRVTPKTFKFGVGVLARCPCCAESKSQHLAMWESDGWWHVKCQKGHTEAEILSSMNLSEEDRKIIQVEATDDRSVYIYTDPQGRYIFEKVRYKAKGGNKGFIQQVTQIGGKPTQRIANQYKQLKFPTPTQAGLNGESKVLYRLPTLVTALADGKTIYIGEGEKAADLMWRSGVPATCQPDGAGRGKWKPEHTDWLRDAKKIVIIADRDEAGEDYAVQVWMALTEAGRDVTIVRSKTTNPKDDAYDHFSAGFGVDDFEIATDLMKVPDREAILNKLGAQCLASVMPVEVRWLWYPYIPKGRCTILDGDGDTGKTYAMCALAAGITNGILPNGLSTGDERRNVLLLMSEDEADDTIVPRIMSLGGNMENVYHMKDLFPFDSAGFARLRDACLTIQPLLIVIDPVLAYVGASVNINQTNEVRPIFDKLKTIIREFDCGEVNIRHEGKSNEGRAKHHAGIGSVDIRNIHRSQLTVEWSKDEKGLRIIRHRKHNYSEEGSAFGYQFVKGQFMWRWDIPEDAAPQTQATKEENCATFLRQLLTGQYFPRPEVLELAAKSGYSEKTVERSKASIGKAFISMNSGTGAGKVWHIQTDENSYDPWADQ